MAEDRLQKIIARAGVSSRRAAEELITKGRVRGNGKVVTELGSRANPAKDTIEIDGRRLVAEDFVYVVLHKPRLVVSTLDDPEGRPTVADLVRDVGARVHPVGRLDFHTSGTLLLTNDGELTNGLLHPRRAVDKTYVVKTQGEMTPDDIARWENGVELEDGKTLPANVHFDRHEAGKTWLEVTLIEGRNQQIRRMGEATGFPVMRLARLSFAGITTEGLPPGRWRHLTAEELMALREAYGVPKRIRPSRGAEKQDTTAWRPGPRPTHGKGSASRGGVGREREERSPRFEEIKARPSRFGGDAPPKRRPSERAFGEEPRGARAQGDFAGPPKRRDDRGAPSRTDGPRGAKPVEQRGGRSQRDDRRAPPRDEARSSFSRRDDRRPPPRAGARPAFGANDERRGPNAREARPSADRRPPLRGAPREERPSTDRRPPSFRGAPREERPSTDRRPPSFRGAPRDERAGNDRRPPALRGAPRDDRPTEPRRPPSRGRDGAAPRPREDRGPSPARPAPRRDDARPPKPREGAAKPRPRDDTKGGGKRPRQNNDAAVSSAQTHDSRDTRKTSPSRTKRPR